MGPHLVAREGGDARESADVGQRVREEVDKNGGERLAPEDRESDPDVAHVGDSRIGEEALDVALRERRDSRGTWTAPPMPRRPPGIAREGRRRKRRQRPERER